MSARMVKYTEIKPVIMEDAPDAHNVFIVVNNQRFTVTPFGLDTKDDAEMMQQQLCIALAAIVRAETKVTE